MDLIDNKDTYKDIPVSKLDLSVRSSNCLHRANISTLYELIEAYNKGLLLDIRNLGKLSFDEIVSKIRDIEFGLKDIELLYNCQKERVIPDEIENIDILKLRLNSRQYHCLKEGGIKTVGELMRLHPSDLMHFHGAGSGTIASIKNVINELYDRGIDYFQIVQEEPVRRTDDKSKKIDLDTVRKLRSDYGFKPILLSDWYGVSRQRAYQLMNKRLNRGNWLNRDFGEIEEVLLQKIIDTNTFYAEYVDGKKAYFFNNKKDDCAVVYVSEYEIKCFFLNMLPEKFRQQILDKRFNYLTSEELETASQGERVFILRKEYFLPDNSYRFRYLAEARKMNPEEFCKYLTGLPLITAQSTVNDDKILKFLHAHYVDGKLMIPLNNSTQWFRSFIARNGYTIEDIARLYELDGESKTDPIEYDLNTIEEDMKDYGEADSWISTLYARNPLIGNAIISKDTREELLVATKRYLKDILNGERKNITLEEKMQITLMVVTLAKEWNTSNESGFWKYITSQFASRDDNGRLRDIICNSVLEALQQNHRWFVSTITGLQYKSTIVTHALTTKLSWMRFFDFLFDFYKNNMDWNYIEDDPIITRMVEALKKKLISGDDDNEDKFEISNNVYTFQEGIRKLVIYKTRYATHLINHILQRIDETFDLLPTPPKLYVDELCDLWMEEKTRIASNAKSNTTNRSRRNVAIDYTKIRPFYSLVNEKEIKISFPDIRLKKTDFNKAELIIYSDNEVIERRSLIFYGNELGKSLSNFDINVDKCLRNGNGTFHLRTKLIYDQETIYDSCDELYRDFLCFSGNKEVSISSCKKGNYSFFAPSNTRLDFLSAEISEIPVSGALEGYYVKLDDGFIIKKDVNVLAFDVSSESYKSKVKCVLPRRKNGIVFIQNGKRYDIISESENINLIVEKNYDYKKIKLLMNNNHISLYNFEKEPVGEGILYKIPIIFNDKKTCDFEIIDLENNRLLTKASLVYKASLSWRFDKGIYYSRTDYDNACVRLFDDQKVYLEKFYSEDEIVKISVDDGLYEINIPKIYIRNIVGEYWEPERVFWIKEFTQNDRIYINKPNNCEVRLSVGNIDVCEETKNTYSIGNAVYALSVYDSEDLIDISLHVIVSGNTYRYTLGKISIIERFLISPRFDFHEGSLYWNRGYRFIGDCETEIKLIVSGNKVEKSYLLNPNDSLAVNNIDIPLGKYDYRIVKESTNIFSVEEDILAEGTLIIGDEDAFRFTDSIIRITSISNEDNGQLQNVEIRGTYIKNIEYDGIQYVDSEERECAVYKGTMFYMGKSGIHHIYSFEEKIDGTHTVYKVNPVKIVFINEHTISITNDEGDGLYYYRYFNRDNMTNVYLITDREPEVNSQGNYYLADLYLYQKEKIKNV